MSKKLTELIAEAETRREQKGTGVKNRAVFLALRSDIKEAINDGWALKPIYRTLYTQKKVTCSYQTFVNYANELILMPKPAQAMSQPDPKTEASRHEQKSFTTKPLPKKSFELPGFTFNPIPNKEDLI
jgi:hypothetical protein